MHLFVLRQIVLYRFFLYTYARFYIAILINSKKLKNAYPVSVHQILLLKVFNDDVILLPDIPDEYSYHEYYDEQVVYDFFND